MHVAANLTTWEKITGGTPKQKLFKLVLLDLLGVRFGVVGIIFAAKLYDSNLFFINHLHHEQPLALRDYTLNLACMLIGVFSTINAFILDGLKNILFATELAIVLFNLAVAVEFLALVLAASDVTTLALFVVDSSVVFLISTWVFICRDPNRVRVHTSTPNFLIPLLSLFILGSHVVFLVVLCMALSERRNEQLWLEMFVILIGMCGASVSLLCSEFSIFLEYYNVDSLLIGISLLPYMVAFLPLCVGAFALQTMEVAFWAWVGFFFVCLALYLMIYAFFVIKQSI